MRSLPTLTLTVFWSALLVGCAAKPTVSEFQCLAGDWQTIGYRDGAAGLPNTRLLSHQEACGPHGVIPNRDVYLLGWNSGLATYCTPENGFRLGSSGKREHGLCDAEFGDAFSLAYADGRQLYAARAAVAQARQALHHAENRLTQVKQEIIDVTTAQLQPDLTTVERVDLVADLNRLIDERVELKAAIPELASALQLRQRELDDLQQLVAYQG